MESSKDITAAIAAGLAAHRVGDIATARLQYKTALRGAPDNPEALHLLGLVYEQEGDRTGAFRLITRAVSIDPREPTFRINLAALFEKEARYRDAATHLRKALVAAPNAEDISMRLADAETRSGNAAAGIKIFQNILKNNPRNPAALYGLGLSLMHARAFGEALRASLSALEIQPVNRQAYRLAASAATELRNWRALAKVGEQWRVALREDEDALHCLTSAYFELGDYDKTREIYQELISRNPQSAELLTAFARLCLSRFDYETAQNALEKAQKLKPGVGETLFALSRLNLFLGKLDQACDYCEQAIDALPGFAPAYTQLVKLKDGDVSDSFVESMGALAKKESLSRDHAASLHFALGEVHHRKGEFEEAMRQFSEGNGIAYAMQAAEGLAYDASKNEALRGRELKLFGEQAGDKEFEPSPVVPIFIVGMPRSGTTLIESILAAHPNVYGAGELTSLPTVHSDVLRWATQSGASSLEQAPAKDLAQWRSQYFQSLPRIHGAGFIVDKQLANLRSIGLIKSLFPEAHIVHVRRNPVETGFSIFRHHFSKVWTFAAKFEDIAHFYGEYAKISSYWSQKLQASFPLFQYERLIENFEEEAHRLVTHCGLDWRDECLEFHRAERPVATFSSTQVRQPLMRNETSAKDQYGAHLQPLVDGLSDAGIDLQTGALLSGA